MAIAVQIEYARLQLGEGVLAAFVLRRWIYEPRGCTGGVLAVDRKADGEYHIFRTFSTFRSLVAVRVSSLNHDFH